MTIQKTNVKKSFFFAFLTAIFLYMGQQEACAQIEKDGAWETIHSAYFAIYYKPDVNLKKIFSRISGRYIGSDYNRPSSTLTGIEEKIAYRVDKILIRVKDILGMYPGKFNVKIKIFKKRGDVSAQYCGLITVENDCPAFYIHSFKTIFTSEQGISDSVLSHEMAHALIDNYFGTTPPNKLAEILATNVDQHLDD